MKESAKNKTKGVISAVLVFVFWLVCVPVIAALVAGALMVTLGEGMVPLLSVGIVIIFILCIPVAIWTGWKRYKKFNPS